MPIIGIDLGTSDSAAAFLRGGRPIIIRAPKASHRAAKAFPSYVALTADGQMLVRTDRMAAARVKEAGEVAKIEGSTSRATRLPFLASGPSGLLAARLRIGMPVFSSPVHLASSSANLMDAGIIDPTKVVRIAPENAVSVASVLLSTEATMTEIPEEKKERATETELAM